MRFGKRIAIRFISSLFRVLSALPALIARTEMTPVVGTGSVSVASILFEHSIAPSMIPLFRRSDIVLPPLYILCFRICAHFGRRRGHWHCRHRLGRVPLFRRLNQFPLPLLQLLALLLQLHFLCFAAVIFTNRLSMQFNNGCNLLIEPRVLIIVVLFLSALVAFPVVAWRLQSR